MSVETFEDHTTQSSYNQSVPTAEQDDEEYPEILTINDVRITPGHMYFRNAYEGKQYVQKMVIQNCGTHLAFVRLSEPSSKSFEFKSFIEGIYLSPGMKIIRTVKYTYMSVLGVLKAFATIWVNNEEAVYNFIVHLSSAIISVEPQLIDFGRMDAVNHAATRTFYIKNSGHKGSLFAIDLGRNPLEIIVEPLKGILPAMTSVSVSIEIVGSREGEFVEEFWIKTSPPQRVVITGVFISPKLLVRKFINSLDFILLDFPMTYYGSESTQPLLIKNFSSQHSMFCIMAEIKGTTVPLEDAREINDNYKNFILKPIDGRMAALRGASIQVTFAPVTTRKREKNYAACFLKVVRMDCRDVNASDRIFEDTQTLRSLSYSDIETNVSMVPKERENLMYTQGEVDSISIIYEDEVAAESFSFEHGIGICVYGEKEHASVFLRPTAFTLSGLILDKVYYRELYIQNNSRHLPVIVRYRSMAAIDVIPHQFELAPEEGLEVLVAIRTLKLDRVEKKITLELLGRDFPYDKCVVRKVGIATLKIQIEAISVEKKTKFDPCVLCKDLPEKLEPEFPYRLDSSENLKKMQNRDFYLNYIRSLRKRELPQDEALQDYDLTNSRLVKIENIKCQKLDQRLWKDDKPVTSFIPLAPRLLFNVKITPKSIRLKKVAAFTTISDFFEIENFNAFPIHIFVHSSKPSIVFDNNSRYTIRSNEKKKITFTFSNYSIGRYYTNIFVLVNDSTLYEVTAVAHVVPKTLKLETSALEFTETGESYKFFRLINKLNAFTSFEWDVPKGCFKIYPQSGGIKAERSILCLIIYTPDPSQPKVTECDLTSESGQKKILTLSYEKQKHSVVFDTYDIDFNLIPLNVPVRRKVILRNLRNFQVLYSVPGDTPIPGITIDPLKGVLDGLSSQVFVVNILLKTVIQFDTTIIFTVDEESIRVNIKGVVDYPKISLNPDLLHFRKIAPYSFDTLAFKVKNLSNCELFVSFPREELPEFTVAEDEEDQVTHYGRVVLKPGKAKVLFLHFHPQYVSTYSLLMPYVINDIFGPAHINMANTTTPHFFLKKHTDRYDAVPNVAFKPIPRLLPLVRLNCSAYDKTLEFSSLFISLVYFGCDHYNNLTSTEFDITNVSTEIAEICIRIDDLNFPFSLTHVGDTYIEYHEVSYMIVLKPGERATFEVEFFPSEVREYCIKLPIFLRDYYDNRIFNYLTLHGVYKLPTITPSRERCDFEPVPLRLTNNMMLTLHMKNHFEKCDLTAKCDLIGLFSFFEDVKNHKIGDYERRVTLSYDLVSTHCFDTIIYFHCTCEASCSVVLTGVTENCLLTTHAYSHLLKEEGPEELESKSIAYDDERSTSSNRPRFISASVNRNKTCFPLFPTNDDDSDYGTYMRSLQKTLENWLFGQAFYMKSYYKIPEGFSDFCKVAEAREKKIFGGLKKAKFVEIPLLQLIMNIAGRSIRDQLAPGCLPETDDEIKWLTYVTKTNTNVLYYLRGFSVYLPHVRSKLLLNYDQYLLYEKIKRQEKKPMEEAIFYRLSKQCWIDLILQIIKTFFLFRTVHLSQKDFSPKTSFTKLKHHVSSLDFRKSFERGECVITAGIYGEHEMEIMRWLEVCYDEEKNTLWGDTEPPLKKELVFLDEDLRDGLMLGAVTAHYCPYVRNEIKDMYTRPCSAEELLHNACTLVKTWQMLKFSYIISPLALQGGGMVEILLLANYLYDVLPNCTPREEITIQAPLTQTDVTSILLQNLGDDPISYQMVFFGNEIELFVVANSTVWIEPQGKKTVKIRYHAKSVNTTTTNLLLSGETPGYKYAKNVAITLVGVADVSYACMKIPLTVDLYRPCEVIIKTQSPFKVKANYSLYFGYQPASKDQKALFPWEEIKNIKTVKEFVLQDEMCEFDEEGQCETNELFLCQHVGPRNMWLYFTNPEVGDWGIQLTIKGKVTDECLEQIPITLPENYQNFVCRCRRKISLIKNCPMVIKAKLPMINSPLWKARKSMVLQYVTGEEKQFWAERIFTPAGTRILKLILNSETHPMRQVIEETVTYKVQRDKNCPFVTSGSAVIKDVTSEEFFDFPIHPAKNVNLLKLKPFVVKLISEDGDETRFYKFHFKSSAAERRKSSSNKHA